MPDIENVIKGLKYLHDVKRWSPNESEESITARRNITGDAIELLKAQETVEPKKNDVELAGLRTWDWACPECNCILTYRANYCSCCGQAVKWE